MVVQQLTNCGRITVHKVSTDDNHTDLGTKVLPRATVHKHMKTLGLLVDGDSDKALKVVDVVRDGDSGQVLKIVNVLRDGESDQVLKILGYVRDGDSDRVQMNSITCERA